MRTLLRLVLFIVILFGSWYMLALIVVFSPNIDRISQLGALKVGIIFTIIISVAFYVPWKFIKPKGKTMEELGKEKEEDLYKKMIGR